MLIPTDDDQVRPQVVYWLSDFQKSTSGNLATIVPDSSIQLKILPIQNPAIANVFIDSVWLSSPFIKPGEVNYIRAKVSNTGEKAVSGLSITCFTDDKTSGSASVDISPKGSSLVDFGFPASSSGEIRVKLSFEEQPVSFDNQFFAVIHPVAKINVALITSENESYFKKVFDGEEAFTLRVFSHRNIDYTAVGKAGLVIVEDAEKLEGNVLKFLSNFVISGGHLVLTPGETPQPDKLEALSKALSLGTVAYQNAETKTELQIPDKKQPFFSGIFEDIKPDMTMPEVRNTWKWAYWEEDILVDKNKTAFLSARPMGKGEIYIFGSPMGKAYTNFPSHSIFVPVMYKLAIRSQRNQENLAYRIGQSNIQVKLPGAATNTLYTLSNHHLSLIPDQKISGDLMTLTLPKENLTPGYYTLSTPGFAPITLALNSDRQESDMATYSTEELKSIFSKYPNVEVLPIGATNSGSNVSEASLGSGSLWKYCIILSLIFLLAEIL
ncbi:MAG: hypothetical protein K2Q22_01230, partial [Cytophagales bacterium]|nr:hypothetical protein [Cytophagales bacterium]